MDPSATTIHIIVPSIFTEFTQECDYAPFEQLPHDLMKTIFALLSHTSKHMMHSVSSRFTLILHDDRYFTNYLFKKLTKKPNEKQLDFLIKYKLKFVENLILGTLFDAFPEGVRESKIKLIITGCINLTSLDFSLWGKMPEKEFLKEITQLSALYSLNLRFMGIKEKSLEDVGKLTTLKILNLRSNCQIHELKNLTSLQLLEKLNLCFFAGSDKEIDHIVALTKLRILNLSECHNFTNKGLEKLTLLSQLRVLNLCGMNISYATLTALAFLKLESLKLRYGDKLKQFKGLKRYTELTSLSIRLSDYCTESFAMSPLAFRRISMLPQLKVLDFSNTEIDQEGFKYLKRLSKLEHLNLSGYNYNHSLKQKTIKVFKEVFSYLTNLRYLNLHRRTHTDAVMKTICRLTTIQKLNVSDCSLSRRGINHIAKLTELVFLDLSNNPEIEEISFVKITTLTNLKELRLRGNKISNTSAIPIINALTKIKKLYLDSNIITNPIFDHLIKLPFLNHLSLQDNLVEEEEMKKKLSEKEFKFLMW